MSRLYYQELRQDTRQRKAERRARNHELDLQRQAAKYAADQSKLQAQQAAGSQRMKNQSDILNSNMSNLAAGQRFDAEAERDQNRINDARRYQRDVQRRLSASGQLAPGDVPYAYGINPRASEQRRAADAQRERDALLFQQQTQGTDQQADIQYERDQQLAGIQAQQNQQQYGFQRQLTDQSAAIQSQRDFSQNQYSQETLRLSSQLGISEAEAQALLREEAAKNDYGRQSDLSDRKFGQSQQLAEQNFGQSLDLNDQRDFLQSQRQDQEFDQQRGVMQEQAGIQRASADRERHNKRESEGYTYSPEMQARKEKLEASYATMQRAASSGRYTPEQLKENFERLQELESRIYLDVRPSAETESMEDWRKKNTIENPDGSIWKRGDMDYVPKQRTTTSGGSSDSSGASEREYRQKAWEAAGKQRAEDMNNYYSSPDQNIEMPGTQEEYYERSMRAVNPEPTLGGVPDNEPNFGQRSHVPYQAAENYGANPRAFEQRVIEQQRQQRQQQGQQQQRQNPWTKYLADPPEQPQELGQLGQPRSFKQESLRLSNQGFRRVNQDKNQRTRGDYEEAKAAYAIASQDEPSGTEAKRKWQVANAYPHIQASKLRLSTMGESELVQRAAKENPKRTRELVGRMKRHENEVLSLLQKSGLRDNDITRKMQNVISELKEIVASDDLKKQEERDRDLRSLSAPPRDGIRMMP